MRALEKLIKLVEWILVGMFGIMAVLVFGNVVLRYGFNSGIVFSEEVSRFMFMWLTLIGALIVMKDHGHLGMSSVVEKFGERGQRVCRFLADSLTLICCLLLAHGTWKQMIIGMDDHAPVTGIPMGIIQSALFISSVGMALVLAYGIWRQLTGRMPKEELIPFSGSVGE
ncbi:TRAP-type C4-dicarboxylate transport system, small permease component [Propionivibrio dicarboxylicus]|uniref:TRAP transporter small permease protein n=2 Tax=Propionivibrio dicarboxylicus TaxID=83767 RepID=A0A1G8LMQ0_9RHOO|nr:TRAP-type C4-dicarboxylate transport system, small permease component [Propionivibrio dicarboxylicus]